MIILIGDVLACQHCEGPASSGGLRISVQDIPSENRAVGINAHPVPNVTVGARGDDYTWLEERVYFATQLVHLWESPYTGRRE